MKAYLDKRRQLDNGEYPIKIQIAFGGTQTMYNTGLRMAEQNWDAVTQKVVKHPRKDFLNMRIHEFLNTAEDIQYELSKSGTPFTPKDVRDRLAEAFSATEVRSTYTIRDAFNDKYETTKGSTRNKYHSLLLHIEEFDDSILGKTLEELGKAWINKFYAYLSRKVAVNTASVYISAMKAVYNNAIENEKTDYYPFHGMKFKKKETMKRDLSVEELRMLFSLHLEDIRTQRIVDLFKLIFMLRGINAVDLMALKTIDNGYIRYYRRKTGTLYNIKVEPEALEIIEKYRGEEFLVDLWGIYKSVHGFTHRLAYHMGKIFKGKGVTSYWARHSWASIAAELDIPDETVGMGLGHKPALEITNIYINRKLKKVEDANRKIIDYILQKGEYIQ